MNKYEKSDVIIYDIKITNALGDDTKDVGGQLLTMSIYEDMQEPFIFAELVLKDEVDLINKLPIIGEENIQISFKTPGRENITTYNLRVFNITASENATLSLGTSYTLQCVSIEHFVGTSLNVERTYKDLVSNMVNDIMVNVIQTKKKLFIEPTRGIVSLSVPRQKAIKAIDLLRQRAIGMAPTGGVFVFFENQSGFVFKSIEKLFDEGKSTIQSKAFTYTTAVNNDDERSKLMFRNMINYQYLKKTNNAEKLFSGVFNNSTKAYDILTKQYSDTEFKLVEQSNRLTTGQNRKTGLPNSLNFVNSFSNTKDNMFFMTKDSSKPEEFLDAFQSFKQAYATLFNQNILRALVHGDSYLRVGDVVDINIPQASVIDVEKEDPSLSGNYMITKLRHLFYLEQGKFKHRVAFDCNKLGAIK